VEQELEQVTAQLLEQVREQVLVLVQAAGRVAEQVPGKTVERGSPVAEPVLVLVLAKLVPLLAQEST
jgi:hypothetical protein